MPLRTNFFSFHFICGNACKLTHSLVWTLKIRINSTASEQNVCYHVWPSGLFSNLFSVMTEHASVGPRCWGPSCAFGVECRIVWKWRARWCSMIEACACAHIHGRACALVCPSAEIHNRYDALHIRISPLIHVLIVCIHVCWDVCVV